MSDVLVLREIVALAVGAAGARVLPAAPRVAKRTYNRIFNRGFDAGYGRASAAKAKRAGRPPAATVMFDSINVSPLRGVASTSGEAVAGYVDGYWPDFEALARNYPHDRHLSIAVHASEDADCLDVENGDATPEQAPAWVRRQLNRGVRRPVVYCSISVAPQVIEMLARAGIERTQYRLWTAHYTYRAHVCGPASCGYPTRADSTQWTDRAYGRNLDESLCAPGFW
jgi:hypothetical protein